jgi:competence protein ComEA
MRPRVRDEDHWHIPRVGEKPRPSSSAQPGVPGKININAATPEVLKTLPGIGDVKAKAIVAHRDTNGSFTKVDDLLRVTGIGPATLAAIRDLIEAR